MHRYRLLAAVAAALIVVAGIVSIASGGTTPLPPPVTLRGSVGETGPIATDGLEFVPARVIDLAPASSTSTTLSPSGGVTSTPADAASADSPAAADSPASADSPDAADSPDSPDD